jgi:hypothetical protein
MALKRKDNYVPPFWVQTSSRYDALDVTYKKNMAGGSPSAELAIFVQTLFLSFYHSFKRLNLFECSLWKIK